MSKALNAGDIFGNVDVVREKFEIQEWGGHIYLQTMSAEALDVYESSVYVADEETGKFKFDHKNATAKLIAACAVDESGKKIFSSDAHVKELGKKNAKVLKRIYYECQRINKLSIAEQEDEEGK